MKKKIILIIIIIIACLLLVVGIHLSSKKAPTIKKIENSFTEDGVYSCIRIDKKDKETDKYQANITIKKGKVTRTRILNTYTFNDKSSYNEYIKNNSIPESIDENNNKIKRDENYEVTTPNENTKYDSNNLIVTQDLISTADNGVTIKDIFKRYSSENYECKLK